MFTPGPSSLGLSGRAGSIPKGESSRKWDSNQTRHPARIMRPVIMTAEVGER